MHLRGQLHRSFASLRMTAHTSAPKLWDTILACTGKFGVVGNLPRSNPFADSAAFRNSQVVVVLKIEPELCSQTEILPQANASVGADGPHPANDFIHARKTHSFCHSISPHPHRLND